MMAAAILDSVILVISSPWNEKMKPNLVDYFYKNNKY